MQAAGQHLLEPAEPAVAQLVGLLLPPFEPALRAEDAKAQAVLGAGRGVGDPHRAPRAARPAHQHAGGVVGAAGPGTLAQTSAITSSSSRPETKAPR